MVSAVPRIAIPSAEPTCLDVLWIPDPSPDWAARDVGEDHAGQLGGCEADTDAVDEELRAELPRRPVGGEGEADGDDPDDLDREPELHDAVRPDPPRERRGEPAGDERTRREGGQHEPGVEGRQARAPTAGRAGSRRRARARRARRSGRRCCRSGRSGSGRARSRRAPDVRARARRRSTRTKPASASTPTANANGMTECPPGERPRKSLLAFHQP